MSCGRRKASSAGSGAESQNRSFLMALKTRSSGASWRSRRSLEVMGDDDVRARIARAAHDALDLALSRAHTSPGDTFTMILPLTAIGAGSASAMVLDALREVSLTRGFAFAHTGGTNIVTMTRTNMPALGVRAVSADARLDVTATLAAEASMSRSDDDDNANDIVELLRLQVDLLTMLMRDRLSDEAEWIAVLALLFAVFSEVIRSFGR
jgi:hypothetical protein